MKITSYLETTWFPFWHWIHMLHYSPWHQRQFLPDGQALWLFYLKLWMLQLHWFKSVWLQVLKLDKCWSWHLSEHWGRKCMFRWSFFPNLSTQVVTWPSGDLPSVPCLVRQNSGFWIWCKRSLQQGLWLNEAGLHFALPVGSHACFAFSQTFTHLFSEFGQETHPAKTKTASLQADEPIK